MGKKAFYIVHLLILLSILVVENNLTFANQLAPLPSVTSNPAINKAALVPTPTLPAIDAKAYVLIDANSGKVLAEKNADEKNSPASLTKLMTMYIASDAIRQGRIKLTDKVVISEKAWRTGGSKMFVKVGEPVPVEQLIKGIIVESGNDACVALSEHIAGSEESFTGLMNQQAAILGMKNSNFTDSTGMPHPNHYTSARDMAVLARAIIQHFPEDYKWYSLKWFEFNGIKQPNRNRLLWRDPTVDGLKTGHTDEAGYCLVSSANRNNMRLVSVILGAPSIQARTEDSQRLLTFGYRFFQTEKLYDKNKPLKEIRVWMGENKYVPVGVKENFYITFPREQYKKLKASIALPAEVHAPITLGQAIGKITITSNNEEIATIPVVAIAANPQGGLFSRMMDSVSLKFHRWFGSDDANPQTVKA